MSSAILIMQALFLFCFRERLDREKQSTYTFQVFVSDGFLPDSSVEASVNQPWKKTSKGRIHTMVTSVVVNVRDQNDNRPTFVQPNATSHLILLDPTTTPGKSILQVKNYSRSVLTIILHSNNLPVKTILYQYEIIFDILL